MTILLRKRALPFPLSKHFFLLPPACRSFHASPRPQFLGLESPALLEAGVSAAQSLLNTIHTSTGLPWVYTLPLAACVIRTTLVLPMTIYQRRARQKQVALTPLMAAWTHTLRKETMAEVGHLGPTAAQDLLLKKVKKKRNEIYKRFGCRMISNYLPVLQLPVWLVVIEAIREKCGKEVGLLGLMLGTPASETTETTTTITKDLSLATEGALWFPDLLVADPMLILPFVLSASMFANLYHNKPKNPSVGQRRLQNVLSGLALGIGPATLQLPSAMLVYWISSSAFALGQAVVLERLMPVKAPVVPSKPREPPTIQLPSSGPP